MFVGHFGIAELGKGTRREVPLLWLAIAAYLPDLTRLALPLVHLEPDLYSHAIPAVVVQGLLLAVIWKLRGGTVGGALVLAAVSFLHWPADVFTGCKPTTADGPWIGLGSYRHPVADLSLEGALLLGGWLLMRWRRVAFSGWWLLPIFALQVSFLVTNYWGSEFYIDQQEWMWKPATSLVPVRHSYETQTCRAKAPE
jgi:hypothetical protein